MMKKNQVIQFFLLLTSLLLVSCNMEGGGTKRRKFQESSFVPLARNANGEICERQLDDSTTPREEPDGSIIITNTCDEEILRIVPTAGQSSVIDMATGEQIATINEEEKFELEGYDVEIDHLGRIFFKGGGYVVPTAYIPVRPDNQVFISKNICICFEGKPQSFGNCSNFCSERNTASPTLFLETSIGEEILLNSRFRSDSSGENGSLYGWCNTELPDGPKNPSCILELQSSQGILSFDIKILKGTNVVSADVTALPFDRTFTARIKETTSNVGSEIVNVKRVDLNPGTKNDPILKIKPINRYTCINNAFDPATQKSAFATKQYYFFAHNIGFGEVVTPLTNDPNDATLNSIFCHDKDLYGFTDSSQYPRLELHEGALHMWSEQDLRFSKLKNQNQDTEDVNLTIREELATRFGQESPNLVIFTKFSWLRNPLEQQASDLGYIMQPFVKTDENGEIDYSQTGTTFCPKQSDYQTRGGVFKILGEIVGLDTEAIYMAKKDDETITLDSGLNIKVPDSFLLIKHSDLEKIWIYFDHNNNNEARMANQEIAETKPVYFYWPPCEGEYCDPTVKRYDGSKLFKVVAPSELNAPTSNPRFGSTTVHPADKSFACIPKTN